MPRKRKPARLFQRKDDGAYVILDGGHQIRTGFGEGFRGQAEEALGRYIQRKILSDHRPMELDKVSIGEILVRYAKEKCRTVKDPERLLNTIKALAPYWADRTVVEVGVETCLEYVRLRAVSAWTVRREMTTLNAALKFAAARRRIPYSPIVILPPKGVAKDRWLNDAEEEALLQQAAPHVRRFIRIAVATGRRKSAITQLRWLPSSNNGWVDLDRGVIHFLGKAEAETKKRKGIVGMPKVLLEEMRTWDHECSHVISYHGQPVKRIDKAFREAAARARLDGVTPHTLKHTAVTRAFIGGMTLELATAYFATSRATLEDVYRSYSPDAHREAAEIMDQTLRPNMHFL